jgi:hypothetical protein
MIALVLMVQMGFSFALPQEGPLRPYRECVTRMVAAVPLERLNYAVLASPLEAECGELRQAALPQLVAQAVERSARSGRRITSVDVERQLPLFLELAVRRAIDDELLARGVDPYPPGPLPAIPRPAPGKVK